MTHKFAASLLTAMAVAAVPLTIAPTAQAEICDLELLDLRRCQGDAGLLHHPDRLIPRLQVFRLRNHR